MKIGGPVVPDTGMRCLYPDQAVDLHHNQTVLMLRQSDGAATKIGAAVAGASITFAIREDGGLNLLYTDGQSDRCVLSREDTDRLRAMLLRRPSKGT